MHAAAGVGVQHSKSVARQRRPAIEGGESEVAEDVLRAGQNPGMAEADVEHRVLVYKVAQPVGALFLVDFDARVFALFVHQLLETFPHRGRLLRGDGVVDSKEAVAVEGFALRVGKSVGAERPFDS